MRVAIFAHNHPEIMAGGAERAAYSLFEAINETDEHEAIFVARASHELVGHDGNLGAFRGRQNEILWATPRVEHFTQTSLDHSAMRRDLLEILEHIKPDVIHFHHYAGFGLDTYKVIKENYTTPVILTLHEYMLICNHNGQMVTTGSYKLCKTSSSAECAMCFPEQTSGKFFLRERMIKYYLKYVDHLISPSQFLADRYIQWGVEKKISVVENLLPAHLIAIEARTPKEPSTKAFIKSEKLRLGYFGQINPYKGAPILLDAIEALSRAQRKRVELTIYGANLDSQSEEFRQKIQTQLEVLGPSCVLHGSYRNEDVIDLMRTCDWLVIPSIWWENSPLVIQEARAAKVPILASNIGGMKEKVLPLQTGMHFVCGSALDLSKKIEDILDGVLTFKFEGEVESATELRDEHTSLYMTAINQLDSVKLSR